MRLVLYTWATLIAVAAIVAPTLIPLAVAYWWVVVNYDRQQRALQRRDAERAALRQRKADRGRISALRGLP